MAAMPFHNPLTLRRMKSPPPDDTGREAGYLKTLGEKQTHVTVRLTGGEAFRGWIEYYDQNMIRLTRDNAPNVFIYKHDILYIAEDGGRGRA
jgi:host factor-I protein